jgi:hypothetical protein
MTYRFFVIPALDSAAAEAELNQVLAASRVLGIERQFVANGEASFWALCVSLAAGPGALPAALKAEQGNGRRIDYREVLNEADFAVFSQLRLLRKSIAEAEGMAPYTVFTNEQLAAAILDERAPLGRSSCFTIHESGNRAAQPAQAGPLPERDGTYRARRAHESGHRSQSATGCRARLRHVQRLRESGFSSTAPGNGPF